ncbi:nucleoside/nucleotide kinase family protein [Cohaesibacter celericrescens]|uniref:Nucleoside/nucleotide kinase family protein n=1 Tax=Cohaesibacter celericrescens TaxID=2067669 RepID=A0A2N5XQT4_9HYPH|nr:nucleoside/nucleotide kinase family protein [Cohaesibacter celericrescens]PLW76882.1 nucleoside/nucleotide kinase family protein [Cohaesibacter celericrescens]
MSTQNEALAELLSAAKRLLQDSNSRRFLAIAGAPGSGKSTKAEALWQELEKSYPGKTAILPMDGFHFDDAVLASKGRRPWKGAPDTFDVGGLRSVLLRLRDASEGEVAVPVFDRELEISRGSARLISPEVDLVIVEGNYLLLRSTPWCDLANCFDLTAMIDVPEDELRRRLRKRWLGFGLDEEGINRKLEANDLPNGRTVIEHSRKADIILKQR